MPECEEEWGGRWRRGGVDWRKSTKIRRQAQKTTRKFIMLICAKVLHLLISLHFESNTYERYFHRTTNFSPHCIEIRLQLCHDTCEKHIVATNMCVRNLLFYKTSRTLPVYRLRGGGMADCAYINAKIKHIYIKSCRRHHERAPKITTLTQF